MVAVSLTIMNIPHSRTVYHNYCCQSIDILLKWLLVGDRWTGVYLVYAQMHPGRVHLLLGGTDGLLCFRGKANSYVVYYVYIHLSPLIIFDLPLWMRQSVQCHHLLDWQSVPSICGG